MNARNNRIATASGSPYAVGFSFGQQIGYRLGENIEKYIRLGPGKHRQIDRDQLRAGAIPWMRMLPERFQQEMEGLAAGSGVSLEQVAEWCYAEECQPGGCSAFMIQLENYTWVARNNDLWAPELWGYATIRAVDGCIPTIHMGMEAEPRNIPSMNAAVRGIINARLQMAGLQAPTMLVHAKRSLCRRLPTPDTNAWSPHWMN
jgi:hypothetical protein